jgi:hypothetical protein
VSARSAIPPSRPRARTGQALVVLAACGALAWYAASSPSTARSTTTTTSSSSVTSTTRPPAEQLGWTAVTRNHGVIVVDRRSFTLADGNLVTVFRFRAGEVRFDLHAGSSDPPGIAAAVGPAGGPRISPAEAPLIVAAFNGGFKRAARSGGFELNGRVFLPILGGRASLVIDANGSARVGVWGAGLPLPGEHVESVRQNLGPLVVAGRLSPQINDLAAWGSTLGNVPAVARSALGQDASGSLMFAASMHALPADLGIALLHAGAVRAMELDINPEWVQLGSTPHPGGALVAGIPNQNRPGDQYQVGWTRDFVTVLAAS